MKKQRILKLSQSQFKGDMSIEEALKSRRTIRTISSKEIDLSVISQLLWALQGTTYTENFPEDEKILHKTAPSASKTYPLEVYTVFQTGLYHYEPRKHMLHLISDEDTRDKLSEAAITLLNRDVSKLHH